MSRSDFNAVLRHACRAGCKVVRTKRHLVIETPSGRKVSASSSPSDRNAHLNLLRDLVKAGVDMDRDRA